MVTKIFAIYDSKAKVFKFPNLQRTNGDALRSFAVAANDTKTEIGMFPVDFSLFEVGEFDDVTGKVTAPGTPVNLGNADSYVNRNANVVDMEGKNV